MTDADPASDPIRVAFVCVQNAGRSQMASAFAEREIERRGLADAVELVTGGTKPANAVHPEVVRTMDEVDIDISERTPREVTHEDLQGCAYVITMGCSAHDVCPAGWAGENRDWALEDPHGEPPATVASIRDEIQQRVKALIDELELESNPDTR